MQMYQKIACVSYMSFPGGSSAGQVVSRSAKRLDRELQEMQKAGLFPCQVQGAINERWIVTMRGAEGTFYAGETFKYSLYVFHLRATSYLQMSCDLPCSIVLK